MEQTRRRTAVTGLLVCVPGLLLGALPALGWNLSHVDRPATQVVEKGRGHGAIYTAPVRISGKVQGPLSPGIGAPIMVTFHNDNQRPIAMKRVRVKIKRIYAPNADASHSCTRLDFEIRQMKRHTLRVPRGRVIDLGSLGLPTSSWPTITMRDRPVNQDGCKGARLTLHFRAARLETRWDA